MTRKSLALTTTLLLLPLTAQAEGTLSLYNWGDYINPAVLEKFTEETGIEVTLDSYGSNEEMLAKIQAGATGYDIVFPSVHMHDILYQLGLLAKTDIGSKPGFENIDPQFVRAKTDPDAAYCLPYAWGNVGIVYNKALAGDIEGWEDFFALGKAGQKITLLDDLRETIGIGLIMDGKSVNSTDPAEVEAAADYIISNLDGVAAFTYDSVPQVISGDVAAAHWYVGANLYVSENPDTIGYVIPKEGATMYQEDICVLASAPNKENAVKFMEFYLKPEIAALNVEQQMNGTPNIPAQKLIPVEIADNATIYPDQAVMDKLQIFEDLGRDLQLYNSEWTRIKTAQ
ncbi:ABC transporter substrate-binding protein [Chachezhania sediminis]|uniref:ABC transporter substrate-binding protein n=1 Tax=Chachezhania sediminis TaxID=2599291 RepID=UPI00131ABABF|nr:spermidine/putrescine ABC transporter substrate-binding protein [Chachezhania sediminis]